MWAGQIAHGDEDFAAELRPSLKANFAGWQQQHFVPDVGLFWQTGHDGGMEFKQSAARDILRGAPGYRPSFNAYMHAETIAIGRIARLAGDEETAAEYEAKAAAIKRLVNSGIRSGSSSLLRKSVTV